MHDSITLSAVWLITVVLLSLRLAAVFALTPLLGSASVPLMIRGLLVVGLAVALSLGLPTEPGGSAVPRELLSSPGLMIQAACTELALGATLALGILLAFAAFTMAGQIPAIQMGLGLGEVLDPATNQSQSVVTNAFQQLGVLVFFLVDGHHALLRALSFSLERFPLGQPWPLQSAAGPLLVQVTGLFSLAFALAVPVVFCLLLLEVALGVVARNMPQVNMIAMGIPVKIVVGLVALAFWLGGMGDAMGRVYASIYQTWDEIFAVSSADAPSPDRALAALSASLGHPEVG